MARGSRRSGLDRLSTRRCFVLALGILLSAARGRENVLAKYPVAYPGVSGAAAAKGVEEGGGGGGSTGRP